MQIDQGEGSAATVTRIMSGAYDAGFGDINAIIQNVLETPETAPLMVYQIYNQPPFSVLTKSDGPVQELSDLEGLRVGGPAGSAATRLFPALAASAGVDVSEVEIVNVATNIQEQMLIRANIEASLVFNVTSYLNLVGLGLDPETEFNWFNYGDNGVDIYSNGVMVSRELAKEHPEAVRGLVRAINRAMKEVIADPAMGAATVKEVEPLIDEELEELRIDFAIENLIISDETETVGLGGVDEERLARSIETIKEAYELDGSLEPSIVFSSDFLPPLDDRTAN
ncbi:ABC transporter substrate-binding protein [uncultured Martelella sp.]|uniref:ABC transporter substrate-binding protein n=1 Tax=uncultured Martelella sp. TaxID=392331 RepID=UPI0029C98D2C|nr:ABC transporter substrate-binding protein [uncultured Martelella sp.]